MPVYEYVCDGCSEVFEVFQKMSDPAPATHSCGSKQVRRILSKTTFALKGDGWYASGYAKPTTEPASSVATPAKEAKATPAASESSSSTNAAAPAPTPAPVQTPKATGGTAAT